MRTHSFSLKGANTPKVVGTGLVALDVLLQDGDRSPDVALGGSTGNVLAILAFLGWSAVPVARLGKDRAGLEIKTEFSSLRADTRFLMEADLAMTPVVYQSPGDSGKTHKFSFSCPFCGRKRSFIPESDTAFCNHVLSQVDSTDVFYFDRVTPWALHLAEAYRERGALVMFEPSQIDSNGSAFQRAIWSSNILKYADDRIEQLESFDRSKVDVEIQTAGANGLQFRRPSSTEHGWHPLDALKISDVADTAGAGDWCTAGLLYYLSKRVKERPLSFQQLSNGLRYGQMLAALNCMLPGARGLARSFDKNFTRVQLSKLLDDDPQGKLCSLNWSSVVSAFLASSRSDSSLPENKARQFVVDKKLTHLCCEPLPH